MIKGTVHSKILILSSFTLSVPNRICLMIQLDYDSEDNDWIIQLFSNES